jgi:hypothetical protein
MGIGDVLKPTGEMFGGALGRMARYAWVLWIFVIVGLIIVGIYLWKLNQQRKTQWTHKLRVKRVLKNGLLSDEIVHLMRRFPLIKNAEVFELEKALLGSFLIPEPGKYTGVNEYSIILDSDNRIWRNEGEYFNPSTGSVNVSARHAEIDLQHATLKADWQNINKVSKRVDWATLAKFALGAIAILAVMVVLIVAIGEWGDAQKAKADGDRVFAGAVTELTRVTESILESKNTDLLILEKLNQLYGTTNIAGTIRNVKENN